MLPDRFLNVWEGDNSYYTASADDESRIDAAVSAYIDSGRTRDSIVSIELTDGRTLYVLASRITSWSVSTVASRRRAQELEAEQKAETDAFKKEFGIWDDSK